MRQCHCIYTLCAHPPFRVLSPPLSPSAPHFPALAVCLRRLPRSFSREHFRCWSGELPALSEIHTYTGLLITGSHSGVNDPDAWIEDLRRFLGKVVVHGGVKVFGTCFGCQLLAQALGGRQGGCTAPATLCNPPPSFFFSTCLPMTYPRVMYPRVTYPRVM